MDRVVALYEALLILIEGWGETDDEVAELAQLVKEVKEAREYVLAEM